MTTIAQDMAYQPPEVRFRIAEAASVEAMGTPWEVFHLFADGSCMHTRENPGEPLSLYDFSASWEERYKTALYYTVEKLEKTLRGNS